MRLLARQLPGVSDFDLHSVSRRTLGYCGTISGTDVDGRKVAPMRFFVDTATGDAAVALPRSEDAVGVGQEIVHIYCDTAFDRLRLN